MLGETMKKCRDANDSLANKLIAGSSETTAAEFPSGQFSPIWSLQLCCSWTFSSLNKALLKQSFHVGLHNSRHKEEVRISNLDLYARVHFSGVKILVFPPRKTDLLIGPLVVRQPGRCQPRWWRCTGRCRSQSSPARGSSEMCRGPSEKRNI